MRLALDFFRQLGIDPVRLSKGSRNIPKYFLDLVRFSTQAKSLKFSLSPVLLDFRDVAGSATGHYFWQDLLAARWIFEASPKKHLDVGSRIDGFVAHLLTFMQVDVLDIRLMNSKVEGLHTTLGNAQESLRELMGSYDSVSSLHSIEHFGLGRYGDPIDPKGHLKGLINISETVSNHGTLIISLPIGKPRLQFNAQRVIHPEWPIEVLRNFDLIEFVLIPWKGDPISDKKPNQVDLSLKGQCGLYRFKKRF
jgi:hypothetical protein